MHDAEPWCPTLQLKSVGFAKYGLALEILATTRCARIFFAPPLRNDSRLFLASETPPLAGLKSTGSHFLICAIGNSPAPIGFYDIFLPVYHRVVGMMRPGSRNPPRAVVLPCEHVSSAFTRRLRFYIAK